MICVINSFRKKSHDSFPSKTLYKHSIYTLTSKIIKINAIMAQPRVYLPHHLTTKAPISAEFELYSDVLVSDFVAPV